MIGTMVVMMGVHRSGDAGFGRAGGMGLVQVEVIKVCLIGLLEVVLIGVNRIWRW